MFSALFMKPMLIMSQRTHFKRLRCPSEVTCSNHQLQRSSIYERFSIFIHSLDAKTNILLPDQTAAPQDPLADAFVVVVAVQLSVS
jgi:hypothetical protein